MNNLLKIDFKNKGGYLWSPRAGLADSWRLRSSHSVIEFAWRDQSDQLLVLCFKYLEAERRAQRDQDEEWAERACSSYIEMVQFKNRHKAKINFPYVYGKISKETYRGVG